MERIIKAEIGKTIVGEVPDDTARLVEPTVHDGSEHFTYWKFNFFAGLETRKTEDR